MNIVVLVLWMFNAAVGLYLLVTSNLARGSQLPDTEPAEVATPAMAAKPGKPGRVNYDPPSLMRAKAEPVPGLRALLEFAHPGLALTGFGLWTGFVLTRERPLAVIAFGVLVATVCFGLSWFAGNKRAARRNPGDAAPSFAPRLLVLHGAGAALTFLLAALVAARI